MKVSAEEVLTKLLYSSSSPLPVSAHHMRPNTLYFHYNMFYRGLKGAIKQGTGLLVLMGLRKGYLVPAGCQIRLPARVGARPDPSRGARVFQGFPGFSRVYQGFEGFPRAGLEEPLCKGVMWEFLFFERASFQRVATNKICQYRVPSGCFAGVGIVCRMRYRKVRAAAEAAANLQKAEKLGRFWGTHRGVLWQ
eukprot:1195434-Prorocentrum_minimum.AAC.5